MTVTGPSFIALQVRDLARAAAFYEQKIGLVRADMSRPGAVVFATTPTLFAVREPLPGTDLSQGIRPGNGIALWLHCDAVEELHASLASGGTEILRAPERGPFGLMFTFADLDGYAVTVHDQA